MCRGLVGLDWQSTGTKRLCETSGVVFTCSVRTSLSSEHTKSWYCEHNEDFKHHRMQAITFAVGGRKKGRTIMFQGMEGGLASVCSLTCPPSLHLPDHLSQ